MSERKWTAAQKQAIESREKNLILSAAAGSGKTATLTERIIRLLKDPESGAELSRMLIVTFTTAAAGELKSRIADALSVSIAKDPKNTSLTRQLASLERAHISTIDSFFKSELQPHFSAIGLPPDFSILDEAEGAVLKKEAMQDTISAHLSGKGKISKADFSALADCISTARNESDLCETLLRICDDLLSYDISPEKLLSKADDLEKCDDFLKTEYSSALKEYMTALSERFSAVFSVLADELSEDEDTQKYVSEAHSLSLLAKELKELYRGSYKSAADYLSRVEFPRLSPIKRGKSSEAYNDFKDARTAFKDEINDLRTAFFSHSEDSIKIAISKTAQRIRALAYVSEYFTSTYAEAKRDRGAADFSDLAVFARKIFVSPEGAPTAAAFETGRKFDYIFIDEYQDTNPVQDSIFSAISKSAGRFMVGDVKQSIYGFRGSCPQLFTAYRERYSETDEGSAIFMSENFRSDKCVIDFSNIVSRYIFSQGKTPFEKCDELVCSKAGGENDHLCEVILVEKEGDNEEAVMPTEAECVAARISELLSGETLSDGTPISPSHIAILLRSGTNAEEFVKALRDKNIPVNNSASEDFFAYGEVLLVLCLLNSADNPLRDIYLAGSMKSPFFGFSLSDLISIRQSTAVPLWYSLLDYCESGTDPVLLEKCLFFKSSVDRWRAAAKELYADEVLRLIVSDTNLRRFGKEGSRTNADIMRSLKVLSDHAAAVSKRGGTLHDLIVHLNSVIEKKDRSAAAGDPDSVTILTVHRSKGLEYPVCFLCEAAKAFNTRDTSEKLLIDRDGNVAMKLYDAEGLIRCDNPLRRALSLKIKNEGTEEEARILYVAMTRARERLIVSCKVKKADEKLSSSSKKAQFPKSTHQILSTQTYGDWIIDALQRDGNGSSFIYKKGADIKSKNILDISKSGENCEYLKEFFKKSLDFSYSKEYLWNIPAKLSVSVLKPDILGGEDEGAYFDRPAVINMPKETPVPDFLSGEKEADGAKKGTATHVFMQFCSFENLKEKGVDAELFRLLENGFISKEDSLLVRKDEIEAFIASDLFDRLLSAKTILRERRFNTLLPACDFTEDPVLRKKLERDDIRITVQGVVDCIFTDSDGNTVLLDYKTDRLTKKELENEEMAREKLLSRHGRQLKIYKAVCEQMMGRPFNEVCIYSLPLAKTIEVK